MRPNLRIIWLFVPGVVAGLMAGLLLLFVARAAGVPAPGALVMDTHEQMGGRPYKAAVSGTMVYIAQDRLVRALDVHIPSAPVQAGLAISLPNAVTALAVDGARLYAATLDDIYILSAANPGDLRLLGVFTAANSVHALAPRGNLLYAGDDGRGLVAVDVSDPANPVQTGRATIVEPLNAVTISGTFAYAATGAPSSSKRLYAVDLSDAPHPVTAGSTGIGGVGRGLVVQGHYAYVSAGSNYVDLVVADVLTPSAMTLVTRTNLIGTPYDVHGGPGGYLYITSLQADDSTSLQVVDIRNASAPALLATANGLGSGLYSGFGQGIVFLADQEGGRLLSVDVNVPQAPHVVGAYAGPARARAIAAGERYAVVADQWNGISVLDLFPPLGAAAPQEVGRAQVNDWNLDVALAGTLAYLASSSSGLHIFDVSNPAAPLLRGVAETPGAASGVALSGTQVYVADGNGGLRILDASNPAAPVEVGSFPTDEWAYDVAAGPRLDAPGRVAYLAGATYFRVIDVTNPSAPHEASFWNTGGINVGVTVSGSLVYLANSTYGLLIFDASMPGPPSPLGNYPWPGVTGVSVSGRYASITGGDGGLRVVDISDPYLPALYASYDTPGYAYGVLALGPTLLIADGEGGVARVRALPVASTVMFPFMRR